MDTAPENLLSRLALALGIGLLIGLERGWRARDAGPGHRTAGVRTFAITGLLGGVVGAIALHGDGGLDVAGAVLVGSAFIAFAGAMTVFGREENRAAQVLSATTTIAALLTFMLGVYASLGERWVAAAAAVAAAGVLIIREELHEWVRRITLTELQSALLLLAMTFIALPLIPDRDVGPHGGMNPHEIWLIAITLAAVSFAGFVAIRLLGERRGVLVASTIGGVVSSTAVLFVNARAAAARQGSVRVLAGGCAFATAVSFARVAAIVAVLNPAMFVSIAAPLAAAALAALAFAVTSLRVRDGVDASPLSQQMRNPFGFLPVVGMAVLMGVVMLLGRIVSHEFGSAGAVSVAAITGVFDVDAMTVSMARLVPASLTTGQGTLAILAGVAAATLGKLVIGAIVGGRRFALAVTAMSAGSVAAGALVLALR